ncbi:ribosome assembly factor SBDS [Candidatus Woesearchaeota archaeon]|nr:MAG: ribosome assembly factor SBDS [Candidatus Woesearchaeota archaeon]
MKDFKQKPGALGQEKISFNVARLKKGGATFEIAIDPDFAVKYHEGEEDVDVKDVLRSQHIFTDVSRGLHASEEELKRVFGTDDELKVAQIILDSGEIQFTQEYREKLREKKLNRIISLIQRNAVDPTTKLPIPRSRIENAVEQLKLKVKELEPVQRQVDDFVKKMMPLFPIRLEQIVVELSIPGTYAHQSYGILKKFGEIQKETWGQDGGLVVHLEIPAGVQNDLIDELNNLCHSEVGFKIIKEV